MSYEAIIFDLGGVLIDIDYQRTVRAFQDLGANTDAILYSQHVQSELFDRFETGHISSQHFINQLKTYLPGTVTPNQVVHAWNAMLLDFNSEKLEILLDLRKRYPLYLLSNTNSIHLDCVRRRLARVSSQPLEFYFDKVYLSQEIGKRKPHPTTFEFVCNDAGLTPAKTLFIDDTQQHIDGASSIGLQTHLFSQNHTFDSLFS